MRGIIAFVWDLCYVYISELFPTVVRSLALGIISAGGTMGSILCPFLITFSKSLNINPLVLFGVIGIIGGLSAIPLKETFKTRL